MYKSQVVSLRQQFAFRCLLSYEQDGDDRTIAAHVQVPLCISADFLQCQHFLTLPFVFSRSAGYVATFSRGRFDQLIIQKTFSLTKKS